MRRALLLALLPALACDQCEAPPPPTAGNLDRPGDVVVVTPPDQDGTAHTYAIVSNPEIEQLRVFDVSLLPEGGFVASPNVFFPLSILTGPATSDLAAPRGLPSRVLALDSSDDEIYVIRTADDDGGAAFTRVGPPIATSGEPAAMDAALIADELVVFVSLPEDGALEAIVLDPATAEERARGVIPLPEGARPGDVAVDPTGEAVVVADAVKGFVSIVSLADAADGGDVDAMTVRAVDVGGPSRKIAVGRVELQDGPAPVAVVVRRDALEVAAVRLFRPGYREERYAVIGRAELPGVPTAAYVPDQGDAPLVCCQGFTSSLVEAGVATAAWAAVTLADGRLYYLALDATGPDGRALVAPIDADLDPIGTVSDPNTDVALWVLPDGTTSSPRPTVTITPTDDYGTPPLVPLAGVFETVLLTWQGALPGLAGLGATIDDGTATLDVGEDLADLDVRVDDLAVIVVDDPPADCADTYEARVVAVDGDALDLARAGDGQPALSEADEECIAGAGDATVTLRAAEQWIAESTDRGALGRLSFVGDGDETELDLPGATLTLTRDDDGDPVRDSVLVVPLDANVGFVGLDLPQQPLDTVDGFGDLARQPIAMTGGPMNVPDGEGEAWVAARRILLVTPLRLFSFDEGETDVGDVAAYR